jgi:hypothetical protein
MRQPWLPLRVPGKGRNGILRTTVEICREEILSYYVFASAQRGVLSTKQRKRISSDWHALIENRNCTSLKNLRSILALCKTPRAKKYHVMGSAATVEALPTERSYVLPPRNRSTPMSRYFFHVYDSYLSPDFDGTEFPDIYTA